MWRAPRRNTAEIFRSSSKPSFTSSISGSCPNWSIGCSEIGATAINLQPVEQHTEEAKDEFWIGADELDELIAVKDRLLAMKRAGAPILNTDLLLNLWPNHFRREKAPREVMPCRVGMRNYFIRSDGRVEVCWNFPPIGNVRTQTAREIWYGKEGAERRKETIACETLCLFTCLSQKNLGDKLAMGLKLIRPPKVTFPGARGVAEAKS